jgi:SAM-dependent methyltransferase
MRNAEHWKPTKIVFDSRLQRYVPNPSYVALGSRLTVRASIPTYMGAISAHARGRFLDCGCGDVPYFELYRDRVDETTCIDWGNSLHQNIHVDREVDLSLALPFGDSAFDTILLADVLEHILTPAELIHELARLLASKGKLIVTVPFLYNIHEAPHDYYRYTRYALESLMQRAGLVMLQLTPFGGYPDVLLDLLNKGLEPIKPLCEGLLAGASWLATQPFYERWSSRTSERYPLGYCCVAQKP